MGFDTSQDSYQSLRAIIAERTDRHGTLKRESNNANPVITWCDSNQRNLFLDSITF